MSPLLLVRSGKITRDEFQKVCEKYKIEIDATTLDNIMKRCVSLNLCLLSCTDDGWSGVLCLGVTEMEMA